MTDQKSRNRTSPPGAAGAGKTPRGAHPAARTVAQASSASASRTAGARSAIGAKRAPTAKGSTPSKSPAGAGRLATIRFRSDWREEVNGDVRAGGRLRVEYALERLPGGGVRVAREQGIVAEVHFGPGGQHHTGRVTAGKFEVDIPDDAREVMVWFHRTDGSAISWDSRFGENYRFPISSGAPGQAGGRSSTGKSANRRAASAA